MSRIIDLAKYQGEQINIERKVNIDDAEKYESLLDYVRDNMNSKHAEIFLGSIFDSKVQKEAEDWIGVYVREWVRKNGSIDKYETIESHIQTVCYDILNLGVLTPLTRMKGVTDIFVDGPNKIYYDNYLEGRVPYNEVFKDEAEMLYIMKKIAAAAGKNLNAQEPVVNAQIGNNRFNLMLSRKHKGLGDYHYIAIRVWTDEQLTIDDLIESRMLTHEVAEFIKDAAMSKKIAGLIGGPTGSGKSTALDALIISNIPDWERIDIIQDEDELRATFKYPNKDIISMLTKKGSNEETTYTIARLIEEVSLRNKPDRIIVGEIRKGEDGEKLIYVYTTGHLGWTTGHGNSAIGMVRRIAKMVLTTRPTATIEEIEDDIYATMDIIVFIDLVRVKGREKRRIKEVVELYYSDDGTKKEYRPIFKYNDSIDALERINSISPILATKMRDCEIDPSRWLESV